MLQMLEEKKKKYRVIKQDILALVEKKINKYS